MYTKMGTVESGSERGQSIMHQSCTMEYSGNIDEEMLQLQDVEVEVRSDDEFARRPHRALDFNKADSSQSIQDKIAKFNHLSPR